MAKRDQRGYFVFLRSVRAKTLQSLTRSAGPANPLPNAFIVDDILDELGTALADIGFLFIVGSKETGSMAWSPTTILIKSTEHTWRRLFLRLARGARAILVIPGETPGIVEELNQISEQNMFHKVIVIMPPGVEVDGRHRLWDSVATSLARDGWRLPSFVEEGLVFAVSDSLEPRHSVAYMVQGKRRLETALRELLVEVPDGEPASSVMADVSEIEHESV